MIVFLIFLFTTKTWFIIIGILMLIGVLKTLATDARRQTYDDNFGNPSEIISKSNTGFVVDGVRKLSREDSFRNFFVCGNVGSGKSTCVVIPFLHFVNDASVVINDPSGELLASCHQNLIDKGYEVKVLRLRTPDASCGFNILARAQTSGQINKTAQVIVNATLKDAPDPFWKQLSITLISCLAQILLTQPKEYRNLANIRQLLQLMMSKPKEVDLLFSKANEDLFRTYASFIGYGSKIVAGVVASCAAALQVLGDMDIMRVTSHDTMGDFRDLRTKKQAIFLQNSTVDTEYLHFVIDIYFAQLFEFLLSELPQQDYLPLFLVLDEFGSSLQIPNMDQSIAVLRKTKTGILAVCQSKGQLENQLGKASASTFLECCYTKLYLTGGIDLPTAQILEKRSGKFEFEDEKEIRRVREVITAAEILQIEGETGLVDTGNFPLMKVSLTPYYKQFRFKHITPSPFIFESQVPKTVPLLKLS